MFRNFNLTRASQLALIAGGVLTGSLALPIPAQAQEDTSTATPEQEVVVTGSRIRRIEQEGPSPVVTITAEDMDSRGYNTVLEALNDLSQNAGGGLDQQFTFGFTPSASAVDLRGFGVGRTLVLIDGRRVPVFPLAASGTTNFVDLSSIPSVAIDRIEVLTDGASAIYGSDAVGGVINVILKKHADDQISLRRSDTTQGGGGQTRAQFSTGMDGQDGSNASLFLEYYKQDVLEFADRDYSKSDVFGDEGAFSSFGDPGTLFDPFTGATAPAVNCSTSGGSPGIVGPFCRFNRAQFRELFPEMQRYSLTGKYDRPINENISAFGRVTYLNSRVRTEIEPMALDMAGDLGIALTPDAPNNPTNPAVDTAGNYAGNNIVGAFRRRLVEFGPRAETIDNDTLSALIGLRGQIGSSGYSWEGGVGYDEQRVSGLNTGFARKDAFFTALCGPAGPDVDGLCSSGTLNLFEPIPQSVVDQLSTQPRTDAISSIASVDFSVTGDLFDMPAGKAKIAAVAEYNRQSFADRRDPDVLAGNVVALGGTAGGGSRKYYAAGVELELPVFSQLTVNLAGRYDKYNDASDVGGAFSPRVALEYRPFKSLLIRGAAGKSFRAPDLQRLFGAETTAFTDLIDTPTCVAAGGTKGVSQGLPPGTFDVCTDLVQSTEIRQGANRDLKEESGDNFSGGIVWEALRGLTLTADAFYIELNDIVNTPDLQTILDQNALNGDFASAIVHNATAVSAINPGGLDLVSAQARNLSLQRTRGIDFSGDYRMPIGNAGNLQFTLHGTYIDEMAIRQSDADPLIDVLKDGSLAEEVRFKGNAKVAWNRGPLGAAAFLNYVGPFTTFFPDVQPRVASWTTLNLSGSYEMPWKGTLQLGVTNVFNKDPPLYTANGTASQPFYNQFFHDPYGSSWFVNYAQKF